MTTDSDAEFPRHRMRTEDGHPGMLDWRSRRQQQGYRERVEAQSLPSLRRYNLTISHREKFVWFRVAKSGTTTILDELTSRGAQLDVVRATNVHYPVREYSSYYRFGFVRNPWDRLVSCWKTKVRKGNFLNLDPDIHEQSQEFEHFVDYVSGLDLSNCNNHIRLQAALIDLNEVDFVGRLESLNDDLALVLRAVGLPDSNIGARNVSTRADSSVYRRFYDDDLADRVATLYQRDVQLFGYRF